MLDPKPLFPEGTHPRLRIMDPSNSHRARQVQRRYATGLKYYFIDFDLGSKFDPGESQFVTGRDRRNLNRSTCELGNEVPYDPFLLDVFSLATVFNSAFLMVRTRLIYLISLYTISDNDSYQKYAQALAELRAAACEPFIDLRKRLRYPKETDL